MKINTTTLQSLDPSKSYYLSDKGEIEQSGFKQWLKCLFNIGDGRAKAAALALKVKEALLADGAISADAALDGDIAGLNTTRSLSGAAIAAIAGRFRASHAVEVGRADARRMAEDIAESLVGHWEKSYSVYPDQISLGHMKRLAVYAATPVIANAANYADAASLERALRSKMNLFTAIISNAGMYNWQMKLGYPAEQTAQLADGTRVHMSGPRLVLDEVHARLLLACIADNGANISMKDFFASLGKMSERDLLGMKSKIEAIPLPDARQPGSLDAYLNAFRAAYNAHTVEMGGAAGRLGDLPKSIDKGLQTLVDEMRDIYGEEAVPRDAHIFDYVSGTSFISEVRPLATTANSAHRTLLPDEVRDALRDKCRFGVAVEVVRARAQALADAANLGTVKSSSVRYFLTNNTTFCGELLACKNPSEVERVLAKHEGELKIGK